MYRIPYADPAAVIADAFGLLLPPEREDVDQWACGKRWMANAGGGVVGRYSHLDTPYTVEPSRCLTSQLYLTTALVGPGQCGKTVICENWLGHSVDTDPASFLWYMQSDDVHPTADGQLVIAAAVEERMRAAHLV